MFGYVIPDKSELKIKHFNLYRAFYCGVCKAIGERYGQLPRVALNYDLAFFALLFSGMTGEYEREQGRCAVKGFRKYGYVTGRYVDMAADLNVALAYCKLRDNVEDEGDIRSRTGRILLKRAYKKSMSYIPGIAEETDVMFARQVELEKLECWSPDIAAEPFAEYMMFLAKTAMKDTGDDEGVLDMCNMLGRWIYTIDAADDYEDDIRSNSYNVFRFSDGGIGKAEQILFLLLNRMYDSYRRIVFKDDDIRIICENIVLAGLMKKTDEVIKKIGEIKDEC